MESKFGDPMTVTKLDDTMRTSLYEEVNEGYFFHGTKQENVEGVMKNGIDPRLAHQHAVFGQGIYMAESSTKADQYTGLLSVILTHYSTTNVRLFQTERVCR